MWQGYWARGYWADGYWAIQWDPLVYGAPWMELSPMSVAYSMRRAEARVRAVGVRPVLGLDK